MQCSEPSSPSILDVGPDGPLVVFLFFRVGLGQMEVGLDALLSPVGSCGVSLLHLFGWYAQKLQAHDLIQLIVYEQVNHVLYAYTNKQGKIHL